MSDNSVEIIGEQLSFSKFPGTIEGIQSMSETTATAESGSNSHYGRAWSYASVTTQTSWRVRVRWEDGKLSSIDVPGEVHIAVGDQVIFHSVENQTYKIWHWYGITNLTTGDKFIFNSGNGIITAKKKSFIFRIFAPFAASPAAIPMHFVMVFLLGIASLATAGSLEAAFDYRYYPPPGYSFGSYWFEYFVYFLIAYGVYFLYVRSQVKDGNAKFFQARRTAFDSP